MTTTNTAPAPGVSFIARNKKNMHKYGIILAFFVLCLIVAVVGEVQVARGEWTNNYFLSQDNMLIILRQISINGILAIGMTFVIITAGVDLSVGSVLALSGIVAARFATSNTGLAIGDTVTRFPSSTAISAGWVTAIFWISRYRW